MWVIDLTNPPPRLRGRLSRWAVEVRAGLYVGTASGKMRDAIWGLVLKELVSSPTANAVLIYSANTSQGFEVMTAGEDRREMVDVDGLWLARFLPKPEPPEVSEAEAEEAEAPLDIDPEYLKNL